MPMLTRQIVGQCRQVCGRGEEDSCNIPRGFRHCCERDTLGDTQQAVPSQRRTYKQSCCDLCDPLTDSHTQQDATPDVAPPAYSSPNDYQTQEPAGSVGDRDIKREDSSSPAGTFAAASSTAKGSELSYDELKAQLALAEKQVAQLKQDQGGLRQRKAGSGAADTKSQPAQLAQAVRQGTEGVPVKITALLCFISFILAYLFF